MAQGQKNIASAVREKIAGIIEDMGYSVWDVEYVKEGASWYLRITIDKPEGITVNDCESVHRAVDPVLDEDDLIETQYYLEVTSPGMERTLRTKEHFEASIGETVRIKLFSALNGRKELIGRLKSIDDKGSITMTLSDSGEDFTLSKQAISRVNIFYDFDNDK